MNRIPGFRSGRLRNQVLAIIGYLIYFVMLLAAMFGSWTFGQGIRNVIAATVLFLAFLYPIANLRGVRQKFFFFNRPKLFNRFVGYVGYGFLSFVLYGMIYTSYPTAPLVRSVPTAQANVQTTAQIQAEVDQKAKQEADAKAKAEADAKVKAEADAKAKAEQEAKAKAEADAKAKAAAKAKADEAAKQAASASSTQQAATPTTPSAPVTQQVAVSIVSISSPAPRNSTATVVAHVAPGATASIEVDFKSGPSKAKGLETKTADAEGNVSWSWHMGGNTTIGSWPVIVTSDGQSAEGSIEVVH